MVLHMTSAFLQGSWDAERCCCSRPAPVPGLHDLPLLQAIDTLQANNTLYMCCLLAAESTHPVDPAASQGAGEATECPSGSAFWLATLPILFRHAALGRQCDMFVSLFYPAASQGAGEVMDCPAPGLHDQALEDCCTEFLAATAAAAGPATPAMSAPACGYPPQHTLAHQQQQQFVNGRSCAIPAVSSVSGGAARAAAAAAAGDAGGYIPTAEALARELRSSGGLCRQGSLLLLQADSCMDAVLYVASVVRAVLELYTTLLHRWACSKGFHT